MSVLNLFPDRVRWCNPDGTLTREALAMLEVLVGRVGGMLGDVGADVFAPADTASETLAQEVLQTGPAGEALAELVQQQAPARHCYADLVLQAVPYRAGTALDLVDFSFALKDTAVVPGEYGNASTVPRFTVDQQGRLISAQAVPILVDVSQVEGLGSMATQDVGTNYEGGLADKAVTIINGIITAVT